MSLHPEPIGEIPGETARVARAAFPKGTLVTRLRDEFSIIYQDEDFGRLYPSQGQPALTPWRLALVTVFQFLENLSDRQAADAVRARIDWKYALGLELTDPGFHFSVLGEFRARLVAGGGEHLLLDTMLERFKARGLVRARGSSAPTAHTCSPPCAICPSSSWWPRRSAPPSMTWPRSRRTGCARSQSPFGSSATAVGSRATVCPRAGRSARRSPWRSVQTGSSCSMPWTRRMPRPRRASCRWCTRCATSGGCTTRTTTTGGCGGAASRSCRRWPNGCSRPTIPRRTSA